MKVSDYVAEFISKLSPRVYAVCGAGAMHLNDSICHHPGIKAIAMHHEQAAAMAAEADARVTNSIGVVCVTAGPGGTNALTGVACAWVDSIPMLVIAGQVTSSTMAKAGLGERAQGMNELPLRDVAGPITKYARTVYQASAIRWHLERAVYEAMNGRRGPVWLDIPLDVQNAQIDPDNLEAYEPPVDGWLPQIENIDALIEAKRPVMIIGNGVRLSGAEEGLRAFLDRFKMPVVTSWGARDIIPGHECIIGSGGLFGDRASNWAVQNADLILAVGTRLSYPQTGHTRELFAPNAIKIVVDIDGAEASKLPGMVRPIVADAKEFFEKALDRLHGRHVVWQSWLDACCDQRDANPVMLPEYREYKGGINAYHFIEQLGEHLSDEAIIITDVGFSFIPTFQSLKLKPGQRLFHSGGVSPMGWAIPAAVGAAFAAPGRQIVCLTGDGGAMMNLQELQTIAHHKLPISIFVYANDGYATMRITQENHFGRLAVSNPESGLSCPDFEALAATFFRSGEQAGVLRDHEMVDRFLSRILSGSRREPYVTELEMAPHQVIAPRVQSRMKDGKFVPTPIDEMWPYPEKAEAAE